MNAIHSHGSIYKDYILYPMFLWCKVSHLLILEKMNANSTKEKGEKKVQLTTINAYESIVTFFRA
jgi:hypothetical protein